MLQGQQEMKAKNACYVLYYRKRQTATRKQKEYVDSQQTTFFSLLCLEPFGFFSFIRPIYVPFLVLSNGRVAKELIVAYTDKYQEALSSSKM